MSNRVRTRDGRPARSTGRSYTQRLQRTRPYRAPRRMPGWLTEPRWGAQPRVPAILVLLAEAGHLAAAWTEWPAAAARGVFHVVVAGILGVTAVTIYFGSASWPPRLGAARVPLAVAATAVGPACWALGAPAGLAPYGQFPVTAAGATTAVELVAAALLGIGWLTTSHRPEPSPPRRAR